MVAQQSQGHRRGPGLRAGVVLDHGVVRTGPDPPVDRLTLGPDRLDDYVQRLRQPLSGQLSWYVGDLHTAEAAVTVPAPYHTRTDPSGLTRAPAFRPTGLGTSAADLTTHHILA